MRDTSPEVTARLHQLMKKKSGPERLMMGCSMLDLSKKIAESSIRAKEPEITAEDLHIQLFLRFYKCDFKQEERERIIRHLRRNLSIAPRD